MPRKPEQSRQPDLDPNAAAANVAAAKRALRLKRYAQERRLNRQTEYLARICINTRVPQKWRIVDLETGTVWRWEPTTFEGRMEGGTYRPADDIEIRVKEEA